MMFVFMFGSVHTTFLGERGHGKLYQSLQCLQNRNSGKRAVEELSFRYSVL